MGVLMRVDARADGDTVAVGLEPDAGRAWSRRSQPLPLVRGGAQPVQRAVGFPEGRALQGDQRVGALRHAPGDDRLCAHQRGEEIECAVQVARRHFADSPVDIWVAFNVCDF